MNERLFDHVIVSANENWLYLDFWPFVAYAYRTIFPNVKLTLAFVTERSENDPFVKQLRSHGNVVLLRPVREIPQAAQCKLARYFIAAQQHEKEICYIDDIDWIPIEREWYLSKVRQRRSDTLLLVGAEVYGSDYGGQVPASMMTAEASIFRNLFNPTNLPFDTWLYSLGGRQGRHRDIYSRVHHEGMQCTTDAETLGGLLFSDEALIVQLRTERPVPVTFVMRGYDPSKDTIDRTYWRALDLAKLSAGGYLGAHTGRPYLEHKDGNDAIVRYIQQRYNGADVPAPLIKRPQIDIDMRFGSESEREAFICIYENISLSKALLEVGGSHSTTNYLSRYYEMRTIDRDITLANLYPTHFIYAPDNGDSCDLEKVRRGFSCYNTYRPHGALLINNSRYAQSLIEVLPTNKPIVVTDICTEAGRQILSAVVEKSGRSVQYLKNVAIV